MRPYRTVRPCGQSDPAVIAVAQVLVPCTWIIPSAPSPPPTLMIGRKTLLPQSADYTTTLHSIPRTAPRNRSRTRSAHFEMSGWISPKLMVDYFRNGWSTYSEARNLNILAFFNRCKIRARIVSLTFACVAANRGVTPSSVDKFGSASCFNNSCIIPN